MKVMSWGKDGGADSCVDALYVVEIKGAFSIVLLRFGNGSREAYHSHAFNCVNWLVKGKLAEHFFENRHPWRVIKPWWTWRVYRSTFHKVVSDSTSWVISLRGPWANTWFEGRDQVLETTTLKSGRIICK